jgi:hypothetical protein
MLRWRPLTDSGKLAVIAVVRRVSHGQEQEDNERRFTKVINGYEKEHDF